MSSIPCHAAMKEAVQVRVPFVVRGTHLLPGVASLKTQWVEGNVKKSILTKTTRRGTE